MYILTRTGATDAANAGKEFSSRCSCQQVQWSLGCEGSEGSETNHNATTLILLQRNGCKRRKPLCRSYCHSVCLRGQVLCQTSAAYTTAYTECEYCRTACQRSSSIVVVDCALLEKKCAGACTISTLHDCCSTFTCSRGKAKCCDDAYSDAMLAW